MENRLYNVLALVSAFGTAGIKTVRLYESLDNSGDIDLPFNSFVSCGAFDERSRERIRAVKETDIKTIISDCENNGIEILPIYSERFPERLRNIPAAPLVLFIKGNLPDIDSQPAICIVGPRKVSKFGQKAAFSLARRLAKAGMTVISGSAVGADTAAHTGVLDAGGVSVMIVAEGILKALDSSRRDLCRKVLEKGCIVSEHPPRAAAGKYSFPVRNRLLSGMSLGVVIIEAPEKSGALITAGHALDQGRDVFVIPGSLNDKSYKGSNALLRDGAIPLIDSYDILSRYIIDYPEIINIERAFSEDKTQKTNKNSQKNPLSGLSKEAVLVYNNLIKPEFTVDDLSALDMDGAMLLSALTELELEHLVVSLPGGAYKKTV
ncbi:MAG: DNA-processing protein DprA [Clostridia bacterium]|nr:DNA-processing protein DprA [Clostridia bacterium]